MPSNLDRALRGLRARSVLRDLMAVKSEYPREFATRLIRDTCVKDKETCQAEDNVAASYLSYTYIRFYTSQQPTSKRTASETVQKNKTK